MREFTLAVVVWLGLSGLGFAQDWRGTIIIEATFGGDLAAGERAAELDDYAKALEQRLAVFRERMRQADGVKARVLQRDIGQLEGELEAIALNRGATVSLGTKAYVIDQRQLSVDADEGRLVVDRGRNQAELRRLGAPAQAVKLAPMVSQVEPNGTQDGPAAFDMPTRMATIQVDGEAAAVVWIAGLPNPYAMERLDSQTRSQLQTALAGLPGLPIDVQARHKGGQLRWFVTSLQPDVVARDVFAP